MRILQITNKSPYPPKDGGAIAIYNLSTGFAELNHEVTILSMNTKKHRVEIDEIPKEIREKINFQLVDVPAKVMTIPALLNLLFSKKPYNAQRFISRKFRKRLITLLREEKFDVIQLEGLYLCPYIITIRQYSDALIVYRAHNIEHEIWKRTTNMSKGARKFYLNNLSKRLQRFETGFLNDYDLLVPISKRDGEMLDKLGNTKPTFISQTGIDTRKLKPANSLIEYPSIFHIGSLDWTPNQEGLLWFIDNCWADLHKKYPELKFYIAGRNAPQWLIERFKQPNIIFDGEVDDAYEYINSKAIMIVPLFSGSGMRIKLIEGMALGKPIVSTQIGAEGIAVENSKHIIIADEQSEFKAAIEKLINNRDFFDEIGENAVDFIKQNFDNIKITKDLVQFYQSHI